MKTLFHLSLIAVALFFFVGTAHAQILVSNYGTGCVELYNDDGSLNNSCFIDIGGSSTTEGVQCVKLSSNEVFVGDAGSNYIGVYYLSGPNAGMPVPGAGFYITNASSIAALAINVGGSRLYAADNNHAIYAVDLPAGIGPCLPSGNCSVLTAASHDVVVGPDGNVYATDFQNNTGVVLFTPNLVPIHFYHADGTFIEPGSGGGPGLNYPGGMVFDGSGNLWVTNTGNANLADGIFEFTGPLSKSPNPGTFLNFTPDASAFPLGMDLSPVNPPGPLIDSCEGCIVIAELADGTVSQINPTSCTGGTCTLQHPYFTTGGVPKYVRFTENCCDTGYLEICKISCLTDPVAGNFTFTASNEGEQFGPLSIPVNACSGAIQVPNGTLTINELQRVGTEVTDITAYDYNYFGNQINALFSSNLPFTTANVNVVSGDVSTETIAEFVNCASGPGELKICKVAGPGVAIDTDFHFWTAPFPGFSFIQTTVPAGPPPGGYCEIVGSFPVGTFADISEPPILNLPGYQVSNITVNPPDRGGTQTSGSVVAALDSGTTEVTFTNIQPFITNFGFGGTYQCSPAGWMVAGSGSGLPSSYTQAAGFTSLRSGSVSQIDVAISPVRGSNSFFVALYTNSNNLPGTEIAQWNGNMGVGCPGVVSITGITGVDLNAGTSYFLVVGPTNLSSNTYETWNLNNQGAMGLHLDATSGCSSGSGNGCNWTSNGTQTLAAFDIL